MSPMRGHEGRRPEARPRFAVRVVLAMALCGIAALIGITAAGASQSESTKPTLTIGLTYAPPSLDPSKTGNGLSELILFPLINAPLIHQRADGSYAPGLAKSWRYLGKGNKDFELTLRSGARFSDGEPVTAAAVKRWFEYYPKGGGPYAGSLKPLRSIQTVGTSKVVVHLKNPNPILQAVFSETFLWGFVQSPKAVADPKALARKPAGAGPYVLVPSETIAGNRYTLVPNQYFYDQKQIRYGKIIVKVINSASTMLQAIKTGGVDVAVGSPSTVSAAEKVASVVHEPLFTGTIVFLDLSGKLLKPLADVRVRQALNYAIDRKTITQAVLGKYGSPSSEFWTADGFDPKYQNYYPYNPEKAKSLLAAAGYADGFTMKVVVEGSSNEQGQMAAAAAKNLAAIGVNLDIDTVPTAEYLSKIFSGKLPAYFMHWGGIPMWIYHTLFLAPKAGANQHGWSDPALNKLWAQGQGASPAAAKRYWRQMSRRVVTQAEMVPVFLSHNLFYVSKDVGGVSFPGRLAPLATEWFPKK